MRRLRIAATGVVCFAAVLPAASCGAGERATAGPVVRDSAGVRIVESRAARWTKGQGWTVAAEPAVDIGVVEGAPEYQLSNVQTAIRLPDGRIVVADGGSAELRFYDAGGKHLLSAGGKGRGPGEFQRFSGLLLAGRDSLFVFDAAEGRLSFFSTEGNFLGSPRLQPTEDPIYPLFLYVLAGIMGSGDLLFVPDAYPSKFQPKLTLYRDTVPNLLYGRDGVLKDTIGEFSGMDMYSLPMQGGPVWLGGKSRSDVYGDELYITDGNRYEVRVYGRTGELRRIIRLPREPRPVTDADFEKHVIEPFLAGVDDPARRAAIRKMFEEWPRADHMPWISNLIVDDLGYLWVEEYRSPLEEKLPVTWSVFDPDGRWLGSVTLPARFKVKQIGEDFVLGIWEDEYDVQHVRLYDLVRTPA
ncbi:MAG TPA: hypothetical protein VIL13_00005 [Longimicrobiales bacterium]